MSRGVESASPGDSAAPADALSTSARWWVLALLCVSRIGLGFQFQTMGSVAEPVVADLGLNYTEIGTLIGLFMLPGLVLAIPAGIASRYASDRWLTGAGLALLGLGGAIAAVAEGFGMLALGRMACGAGFVLSTLYVAKMVADWFAGKELALLRYAAGRLFAIGEAEQGERVLRKALAADPQDYRAWLELAKWECLSWILTEVFFRFSGPLFANQIMSITTGERSMW